MSVNHYETKKEFNNLIEGGMDCISIDEFYYIIESCGYEVCQNTTFDYVNTSNEFTYRAKSVSYIDKITKRSFAHFEERRDERYKRLQQMRATCFVYHQGVIWEL